MLKLSYGVVRNMDDVLKPVLTPRGSKQVTRRYWLSVLAEYRLRHDESEARSERISVQRPRRTTVIQKTSPPRIPATCQCGCNELFLPVNTRNIYAPGHLTVRLKRRVWRRNNPEGYRAQKRRGRNRKRERLRKRGTYTETYASWLSHEERRKQRLAIDEIMRACGGIQTCELKRRFRVLQRTWRNVTAWTEYVSCPSEIRFSPDPSTQVKNLIYGLVDPRTKLVRYVGLSTRGLRRPREHRVPVEAYAHLHSARWIAELRRFGLTFEIVVLEENPDDVFAAECWWITYGRASGWPLTNLTDGGEGVPGRVMTEDQVSRLSERSRKQWRDPEFRANHPFLKTASSVVSARMKKRWQDPDYRSRATTVLKNAVRRRGEEHHMKRLDVRENHRQAMQRVGKLQAGRKRAIFRHEFARMIWELL